MKVKNIMFSGFMAAVLAGACGAADAATVLASKEFVTTELGKKQDTLTAGTNIAIDPTTNTISSTYEYNDSALSQKVTNLETTIGNAEGGLVKEVAGIKDVIDTLGDADGVATLTNDVSDLKEAMVGLPADTTVAEAIADAVSDKVTNTSLTTTLEGYTTDAEHNALAGRVSANEANITANAQAITGLQSSKADKTALGAYVTSEALSGMGYQTAGDVTTAIGNADIAMSQVTGLNTALGEKAAASDVESLQTTVDGWTNETTGIAATYATKSELAGYATDGELDAVSDVADAAKATADLALPAATFTTFQQTVNAEAIAEAKKAGTDAAEALNTYKGEVTSVLNGKVDDADLNNYYTKSEADTQFLEDAGLANGSAYLVTKDSSGNVVYSEVSVIDGNGDTVIGKAQQ
ncbi:MAG: hypothetical protein J6L70_03880 [Alphaproteobacteria bacterium]|nr:hypothetical protein [Alphaproteobacteria bacterium]